VSKIVVKKFWLQKTTSYPNGAPQREEYVDDAAFEVACRIYERQWREEYICADDNCKNRDCPQHFPYPQSFPDRYSSQTFP